MSDLAPPIGNIQKPNFDGPSMDLLHVGNGDVSVGVIEKLLGPGWWTYVFPPGDPAASSLEPHFSEQGEAAFSVISSIFAVLNILALAFLVVLFVYVMAVGVLGTAHEGEPLGKRYSTLWTPIRSALAVMLLTPLPWAGGLSFLQALLLMFVYYGIGAGNTMTDVAMGYMVKNEGFMQPSYKPLTSVTPIIDNTAQSMIAAVAVHRELDPAEHEPKIFFHSVWEPRVTPPTLWERAFGSSVEKDEEKAEAKVRSFNQEAGVNRACANARKGPGICYVRYDIPDFLQKNGVSDSTLGGAEIACDDFGSANCNLRFDALKEVQFYARFLGIMFSYNLSEDPNSGLLKKGDFSRLRRTLHLVSAEITKKEQEDVNSSSKKNLEAEAEVIRKQGWAMLGAWYNKLAEHDRIELATSNDALGITVQGPNHVQMNQVFQSPESYAQALKAYGVYKNGYAKEYYISDDRDENCIPYERDAKKDGGMVKCMAPTTELSDELQDYAGVTDVSGFSDKALSVLGNALTYGPDYWVDILTHGDPIRNLHNAGNSLVGTVEFIAVGFYGIRIAGAVAAGFTEGGVFGAISGLFTGASIPEGIKAATKIKETYLGETIATGLFALLIAGLALAYYLPLVPFFLWIMGFIGWVILVMEVLVAAPLWAIAHGMPEGEGMAGTHGKQGYMLFLRVLARPMLMVIGFFLALLMFEGIALFIGEGYKIANSGLGASSLTHFTLSPFGLVAYIVLIAILIITVAHRAFGLITWIPSKVLNWIAQLEANLGETEDANAIRGNAYGAFAVIKNEGTNTIANMTRPNDSDNYGVGSDGGRGSKGAKPEHNTEAKKELRADATTPDHRQEQSGYREAAAEHSAYQENSVNTDQNVDGDRKHSSAPVALDGAQNETGIDTGKTGGDHPAVIQRKRGIFGRFRGKRKQGAMNPDHRQEQNGYTEDAAEHGAHQEGSVNTDKSDDGDRKQQTTPVSQGVGQSKTDMDAGKTDGDHPAVVQRKRGVLGRFRGQWQQGAEKPEPGQEQSGYREDAAEHGTHQEGSVNTDKSDDGDRKQQTTPVSQGVGQSKADMDAGKTDGDHPAVVQRKRGVLGRFRSQRHKGAERSKKPGFGYMDDMDKKPTKE